MTATFEHTRKPAIGPASALTAKAVAFKDAMAGLWPPAMIGLGFALTLVWSGGLFWLFVRMIRDLI